MRRFSLLISMLLIVGLWGCDEKKGEDVDILDLTYKMTDYSQGDADENFRVSAKFDDNTYQSGTVTVAGYDAAKYPMPAGFGNGTISVGEKVFANAAFESLEVTATTVTFSWTDPEVPVAQARVAVAPVTYSYTFTLVE